MEEKRICTHCGKVISEGEGTTVNGDLRVMNVLMIIA